MIFKNSTLKKAENLLKESGYTIRYEKGNFAPGFCILEEKKVIVINKYYSVEAKVSALLEIMTTLRIASENLSPESKAFYEKIVQLKLNNLE
jgi:hypothetical protein